MAIPVAARPGSGGGGAGGEVDTELAAALAIADTMSNPTVPQVIAHLVGYNGATWDRLRSTIANGLEVDVTQVQGTVDVSGSSVSVTGAVDTELPAAAAIGDAISATASVPNVGALLALYDGSNYVRGRGDAANGLDVDVTRMPAAARTTDSMAAALVTDALMNGNTALTPKFAFANISASTTDGSVVAAVTSKKLRVLGFVIMAGGTATNVTLNTKPAGAGTAKTCLFACPANGGVAAGFNPLGWFETVSGEGLAATTGAGATTGILVCYAEV